MHVLNAVSSYVHVSGEFPQHFVHIVQEFQRFRTQHAHDDQHGHASNFMLNCVLQMSKGITVKDVSSHEFVVSYAAHLKKQGKIQLPELVDLMKTGIFKELAPYNDDWFYVRCGMF